MKKMRFLAFSSLMAVLPLSGCQTTSTDKIEIKRSEGAVAIDLTGQELQAKIALSDDFILYLYDPGCSACAEFVNIFDAYIAANSAILYKVRGSAILTASNIATSTFPEIVAINDGQVAGRTKDLQTAAAFAAFVDQYAFLSSKIRISEEKLDQKIAAKESFIIEYTWEKCGDCNAANSLFIDRFIADNPEKIFYEFELSDYYDRREDSNDPIWIAMTAKYQLSAVSSAEFGWNNGVVPTFHYYDRGTLTSAVVLFNDVVETETDSLGTVVKATVKASYFADSPFVGQTFVASDSENATSVYRAATADFYRQKMCSLFAYYYK